MKNEKMKETNKHKKCGCERVFPTVNLIIILEKNGAVCYKLCMNASLWIQSVYNEWDDVLLQWMWMHNQKHEDHTQEQSKHDDHIRLSTQLRKTDNKTE